MKKGLIVICTVIILMILASCTAAVEEQATPMVTDAPTATPTLEPTPSPTLTPSPSPTHVPTPTPTLEPIKGPDTIGIYLYVKGKSGRQLITEHVSDWRRGTDIATFNSIVSNEESIPGSYRDILIDKWNDYEDADDYKIGYCLSYTLYSGEQISYTITTPEDIVHKEYLEVYLYDSVHQTPGVWYSHLEPNQMKDNTLMTSFKLTPGEQIDEVESITLKNFIYKDDYDFDAETGEYIGRVSYEIPITRAQ